MLVIMFGGEFWWCVVDFDVLVVEGVILVKDIELMIFVESVEEVWKVVWDFYVK